MSDSCYRLLLIDTDRIFRMGMRSWLSGFADLELVSEIESCEELQAFLDQDEVAVDLVILDLKMDLPRGLERGDRWSGLTICQEILVKFPKVPIFGLSAPMPIPVVQAALQMGMRGFGLKGIGDEELAIALRQVAAGNCYLGDRYGMAQPIGDRDALSYGESPVNVAGDRASILNLVKRSFYRSGVSQIDRSLAEVRAMLTNINVNHVNHINHTNQGDRWTHQLNQMILAGQARELQAAKWLMSKVWGDHLSDAPAVNSTAITYANPTSKIPESPVLNKGELLKTDPNALVVQASLWDRAVAKLQINLVNLSKVPLEIDILKDEQKRELLYIVLRQIERIITELRFAQIPPSQLESQIPDILRDIWQSSTTDFFGKYYTLDVSDPSITTSIYPPLNLVEVLLNDAAIIQTEFLDKLPQLDELFAHLLWGTDLTVNSSKSVIGSVEAMQRSELILDHLLIQVANAVIQPLLNHFADVESIKQKFYRYNLLATREIEKFRNDLSWKYRLAKYITDPQLIFESRHLLFALTDSGIRKVSIYAPRNQELEKLAGVQLAVTLALELQDAIAPRLRTAISFVGTGFVYVLTNVIGRGLGLIGRGILQGIGNAWQDTRK